MDFFARQEESRRLSRLLVMAFIAAVLCVTVAVDAVLLTVIANLSPGIERAGFTLPDASWLAAHPAPVLWTTVAVLAVIGASSLGRTATLRAGGSAVARSLGGERVTADTRDPARRRLLNVVEEMSIAAGVPMPEVYVLEREPGINAFAAGHTPANAAIAVTRGALTTLSRTELQGVIGHEFSHVLNGDMRLNVRLIGLLFGILVVALIARTVLRYAPRMRGGRGKSGGAIALVLAAAVVILVLGYVGLFFARVIQAAVARRREQLADASAVQFTRDLSGLKGALVKIGATSAGSRLVDADAEEVGHMLFAPGMRRLLATHPSLLERIRALDPGFDPGEIDRVRAELELARTRTAAPAPEAPVPTSAAKLEGLFRGAVILTPAAVAGRVANPGTADVDVAEVLRAALPAEIVAADESAESAVEMLFALAIDADPGVRAGQLATIGEQLGQRIAAGAEHRQPAVMSLHAAQRIPALTRIFPALRQLSTGERARLLDCLKELLAQESGASIYAYALRKVAQVNLRDELTPPGTRQRLTLAAAAEALGVLFSVLAQHGATDPRSARQAYEIGMHHLLPQQRPRMSEVTRWPQRLDLALDRLDRLLPAAKEQLVEALVMTIGHDNRLTLAESELLRAICATVHCPLPALIAGGGE
jgi:Zn-dependent protease with chaperone function